MKRFAFCAVVVVITLFVTTSALGQFVTPANTVAYGRTYSEWSAAWQQWSLSVPVSRNPLFDNGDCSVGQSGPVWFLGGKFCSIDNPNCGTTKVVRSCTVPSGKALYIAVINSEYSVLEMNDPKAQIADLRTYAGAAIDGATNVILDLDGVSVPRLKKDFRVQSTAFAFTLPDENLFNAVGEGPYLGGSYFPGIDDGIYVMLSPLPPGPHTIHFHGYFPIWNFKLDVTYKITVVR